MLYAASLLQRYLIRCQNSDSRKTHISLCQIWFRSTRRVCLLLSIIRAIAKVRTLGRRNDERYPPILQVIKLSSLDLMCQAHGSDVSADSDGSETRCLITRFIILGAANMDRSNLVHLPARTSLTNINSRAPTYLIISGGTGANSFVSAFGSSPAFVLPVSDDGGSSAEILRCFGGPSIGDIREIPVRDVSETQALD